MYNAVMSEQEYIVLEVRGGRIKLAVSDGISASSAGYDFDSFRLIDPSFHDVDSFVYSSV